jgi:hypothetical protein
MKQLIENLRRFLVGLTRLDTITYKPGWNRWSFLPLYLFDYGTRVLTGGACVSWSRWLYLRREKSRSAAFITRLLNHIEPRHGEYAGDALWGTKDCPGRVRGTLLTIWLLLAAWGILL